MYKARTKRRGGAAPVEHLVTLLGKYKPSMHRLHFANFNIIFYFKQNVDQLLKM